MGAAKQAMMKDGLDPNILDGDLEKPATNIVALKDDPKYAKYFKMVRH